MAKAQPSLSACAYIDNMVSRLRQLLAVAIRHSDVEAIHDARVATRRLKAAMDLLGQTVPPRELTVFMKGLRRIRRRLGPLRDLDIMLYHLREFSKGRHVEAAAWMGQQLEARRQTLREQTARKTPARRLLAQLGTWWGVHDDVADLDERAPELLALAIPGQLAAFRQLANQLAQTPAGEQAAADPADPHAVRIAGKLLRYTLELAIVAGLPVKKEVLRSFKRLQDALGLWHDFVVLTHSCIAMSSEAELAFHRPELFGEILELAKAAWKKAKRELAKFEKFWVETGDELSSRIMVSLPPLSNPDDGGNAGETVADATPATDSKLSGDVSAPRVQDLSTAPNQSAQPPPEM